MPGMRRREFVSLFGSAAAAWPLAARAQQGERVRRIGVLLPGTANDSEFQIRLGAFVQALALLGWDIGRNVSFDTRWATSNTAELDRHARELAALAPDVILANGSAAAAPLLQATRTVPIVFAIAADPVGAGLVDSLARPGGNATGFITFEYGISAKWLELLKEIAPGVKQVAVFRDPDLALGAGQFGAMQSVAPSFGVEVRPVDVRDAPAIERAITGFASTANGGLIVTGSAAAVVHRELIVRLAAQHKLPGVYAGRFYPAVGGLMSLGPNFADQFRQAAGYVDRILKGEKPADLPVQSPTKYELIINLKTAKTLGLDIPQTLLARADEVIE
jgi:putative tryptophan/tyrosine transport system substrate-binding protein